MRRIFAAVLLTNTSLTAFLAAIAWEALRLTNSAGGPSTAFALGSAASLVVGPLLGVRVDRLGPHRAFRISQSMTGTVALGFAG